MRRIDEGAEVRSLIGFKICLKFFLEYFVLGCHIHSDDYGNLFTIYPLGFRNIIYDLRGSCFGAKHKMLIYLATQVLRARVLEPVDRPA